MDFNKEITSVFIQLNKWFAAKLLYLNLKKYSICAVYDKTLLWMKCPLATVICSLQTLQTQSFLD